MGVSISTHTSHVGAPNMSYHSNSGLSLDCNIDPFTYHV